MNNKKTVEVEWIEKKATVPELLFSALEHNRAGEKAETLNAKVVTFCTGCTRLSGLINELNHDISQNHSQCKMIDDGILKLSYFPIIGKGISTTTELANLVNGIYAPEVLDKKMSDSWCPSLMPTDLNNALDGDIRRNPLASETEYMADLTILNKLALVWCALNEQFDQAIDVYNMASYFMEMDNFQGYLFDIERVIDDHFIELRLELTLLMHIRACIRSLENIMVDFISIYNYISGELGID